MKLSQGVLIKDSNSAWKYVGDMINKIFFFQANHIKESYDYDIARARRVLEVHDNRKQQSQEFW